MILLTDTMSFKGNNVNSQISVQIVQSLFYSEIVLLSARRLWLLTRQIVFFRREIVNKEYYVVGWSGGEYDTAFDCEKTFITLEGANKFFDFILNVANEDRAKGYNTYDATDTIVLCKGTVGSEYDDVIPDWRNPIRSLEWNYETHQWEKDEED